MSKNDQDDDDENDKEVTPNKSRKGIAERELNLLAKCTEAITANAKPKPPPANGSANTKLSAFAVYVDQKLSELKKRDRRIAEKRIYDILFDGDRTKNCLMVKLPLDSFSSFGSLNDPSCIPCIPHTFNIYVN